LEQPSADVYLARGLIRAKRAALLGKAKDVEELGDAREHILELEKGAVEDYSRAIDLEPKPTTYHERGWKLLLMLEAPRLAMPDFKKVLASQPKHSSAHIGRGLCRVQLGNWRGGVDDAEAALRMGADKASGSERVFQLYNLARIFAQSAGRITLETSAKPDQVMLKMRQDHEQRALALVEQAMESLPAGDRRAFWQKTVEGDRALVAVRTLPGYKRLSTVYGTGGKTPELP
jgi:tetratricopeptide (TPR) repeat protein